MLLTVMNLTYLCLVIRFKIHSSYSVPKVINGIQILICLLYLSVLIVSVTNELSLVNVILSSIQVFYYVNIILTNKYLYIPYTYYKRDNVPVKIN